MSTDEDAFFCADEIDLFEIMEIFWKDRNRILFIVVLFLLLGLIVTATVPKVWRGEAVIRPVTENELDSVNKTALDKYLSPATTFDMFHEAVLSIDVMKKAFEKSKEYSDLRKTGSEGWEEKRFKKFVESLSIEKKEFVTERVNSGRLRIVFLSNNYDDVDTVINEGLMPLAEAYVRNRLDKKYNSIRDLKKSQIEYEIKALDEEYYLNLEYRLKLLRRAHRLADVKNIKELRLEVDSAALQESDGISYLLGTKYLDEMIKIEQSNLEAFGEYKNNGNNNAFIPEVAIKRFELQRIDGLDMDFSDLKVIDVEMSAIKPANYIKPNKMLVIGASFVFGLFVALLYSYLMLQMSRSKKIKMERMHGVN
ncbi:MAG: Wzz/FepE/Etk N-terminal domain-containing protein [Endozoicomonas sp.]